MTGDLFGNLNKPVDQPTPQPKVNGTPVNGTYGDAKTGNAEGSTSSIFNKTPSANLFGGSKPLVSPNEYLTHSAILTFFTQSSGPTSQAESTSTGSSPAFLFGSPKLLLPRRRMAPVCSHQ